MKLALIGLRQNKLICITLALMFAGVSFLCVCILPDCIYPYANRVELDRKEVYGELIILVDSEEHGLIDSPDMWAGALIEESTNIFYLPVDPVFYERIASVDGVEAVLKRQITLGSFGVHLSLGHQELLYTGRHVGEDFSKLNEFYEHAEHLAFPGVSDAPPNAVLISENTVRRLAENGIEMEKGMSLKVSSGSSGKTVDLVYWGTYKPLGKYNQIEDPEGIGYSIDAFILNEDAMGALWSKDYEYKSYATAPESLDEVVFPPLWGVEPSGDDVIEAPMLSNELMVRLEDGASADKVAADIQHILDECSSMGTGISYKVVSSMYNVFTDEKIALDNMSTVISRIVSLILSAGSIVLGLIGVNVLIENQRGLIELLSILGRQKMMIVRDLFLQLCMIAAVPSFIGTALACGLMCILCRQVLVASQYVLCSVIFVIAMQAVFMGTSVLIVIRMLKKAGRKR